MLIFFVAVFVCLFLLNSSNLLISLILLEVLSFLVLAFFSVSVAPFSSSDFATLTLFSIFVIEGVIALSGIITLVSHTGSDFVSSSFLSNC